MAQKSPRHRVAYILTVLAGGAALNVAVAWAISTWSVVRLEEMQQGAIRTAAGEKVPYLRWRQTGIELIKWHLYLSRGEEENYPIGERPEWSEVATRHSYNPAVAPFFVNVRCEYAVGWPWLSMRWCYAVKDPPGQEFLEPRFGAIRLTNHRGLRNVAGPRALPLIPLWPGFALNTLFFAIPVFGLASFAGSLRQLHRKLNCRCTQCGYSLQGLPREAPCPECGTGR